MEKQNTINKKLDYETELLVITMEVTWPVKNKRF